MINMEINITHYTPYETVMRAIRFSHASLGRLDSKENKLGPNDKKLLYLVIEQGHHSVLEHFVYTFEVEGVSRAFLQEFVRHRHISLTVQSTRFALKKLLKTNALDDLLVVPCTDPEVPQRYFELYYRNITEQNLKQLEYIKSHIQELPNDVLKYLLPEAFKTAFVATTNARELGHLIELRHKENVLCEFRRFAIELFEKLYEIHPELWEMLRGWYKWDF